MKAEIVVVGGGLAGAAVAVLAAEAGLDVVLIDCGMPLSPPFGGHLLADSRAGFGTILREKLLSALLRSVPNSRESDGDRYRAGLSIALSAGGASALWSGVALRLDAPTDEAFAFAARCLDPFYAEAENLLGLRDPGSAGATMLDGSVSLARLRIARAGRDGERVTAPSDLLSAAGGRSPRILSGHLATRVVTRGDTVTGIDAVNLAAKELRTIRGDVYVVAADAIRSPALLMASGIDAEPGFPVGRWITDHPLAVARVEVRTPFGLGLAEHLAAAQGPVRGVLWRDAPAGVLAIVLRGGAEAQGTELQLFWYGTGHPRAANRLRVTSDQAADFGLFGARTEFAEPVSEPLSDAAMLAHLSATAERLGPPCPGWRPRLLPLGAALHPFGSLRTAPTGIGVTDDHGRVHGLSNLYVVGTSRLPAPCCTNPMLAAIATAVATGRVITGRTAEPAAAGSRASGQTAPRG